METLVKECEAVLLRYLPDPDNMPPGEEPTATIASAMRYSAMAGGKRLRPLLIARVCDMYGGRRELAEPFMGALEMIHTYSLVHDDLPAMDDDDYRRGRKTTHIVYGEGMAVLAGDALLNYAYETAAAAFDAAGTPEETGAVVRALRLLLRNAGIFGMVGGQCADLEAENRQAQSNAAPISAELLEYIHSHKTACLIDSGFTIGAILAGAPEEDIQRLHRISTADLPSALYWQVLPRKTFSAFTGSPTTSALPSRSRTTFLTSSETAKNSEKLSAVMQKTENPPMSPSMDWIRLPATSGA